MKKRLLHLLAIVAAMTGLFSSCSKDNTTPPAPPTSVIVKSFSSPADAANIDLASTTQVVVVFEWAPPTTTSRANGVTYEVLFDHEGGNFTDPVYTVVSDEDGTANKATISKNMLIDIAREAGVNEGEAADLIWSIKTKHGNKALLSSISRRITLVRPDAEPAGPPIVTKLLSPDDEGQADLTSITNLTFAWEEPESDGAKAVHYTLLFDVVGGDFSTPVHTMASASTGLDAKVTLKALQLDEVARRAGIQPNAEGALIWTVLSTVGEDEYLSEQTRSITIKRDPLAPAAVTELKAPDNDASVSLKEIETLLFEWTAAEWAGDTPLTYELLFDKSTGNFTSPVKIMVASNNGMGANVSISRADLDRIAEAAGADIGGTVTVKWNVRTKSGNTKVLSDVSRDLKIVRTSMFTVGDDLYIGGAGSEAGQKFKVVANGGSTNYEIYTKITANQPYYFYSGERDGDGAKFVMNSTDDGFTETSASSVSGAKMSTTGVYRITLTFDSRDAKVETIEKAYIRYAIKTRDAALSYVARGTWRAENYNLLLSKESWGTEVRYKFLFRIDGKDEHWGKHLNPPSETNGDRTMKKVASGMWDGVLDFPSALRDANNLSRYYADVVVNMNTKSDNYTHNFEKIYDSETYYNGDRNPPVGWNWGVAADSISYVLVDQFMNKPRGTFWASAKNCLNNSSVLYWQQAYPMQTLLYSYERIKNSNATLKAEYETYFSRWHANKANNWFTSSSFRNTYTDDMAWMGIALLHMYEATGKTNAAYFNSAKKDIYDTYMMEPNRIINDAQGWGLIWRLEDVGKDSRNACTNTPAGLLAIRIYGLTNDAKYLEDAKKFYNYMRDAAQKRVNNSGRVEEPALTYTQGTWAELCRLLYFYTNETKYRDDATKALTYTMTSGRCTNGAGILRDEGSSGDQSNFKGGLIPYMVNYANDDNMPTDTRQQVKDFLIYNARLLWCNNIDKALYPASFANYSWNSRYREAGNPGSLGAHASGAALIEGVARLK